MQTAQILFKHVLTDGIIRRQYMVLRLITQCSSCSLQDTISGRMGPRRIVQRYTSHRRYMCRFLVMALQLFVQHMWSVQSFYIMGPRCNRGIIPQCFWSRALCPGARVGEPMIIDQPGGMQSYQNV